MASSDDLFFSDLFSPLPFYNPNDVVLHHIPNNQHSLLDHETTVSSSSIDPFSSSFFSFSPPSTHLESLSLYQQHLDGTEFGNFSNLDDGFKVVKSEESQVGSENVHKSIQRSYSSNCFDGKPGFFFQPSYDTLVDSSNFHVQVMNSPENNQVRRACSTGDLQVIVNFD